jgi:1-deoxyxylulose-5-phosphate synthase
MARGYLTGRERRAGTQPIERLRSDDYAQKLYGRNNDTAVAEAIESIAAARKLAPAQLALAWTLSRPGMTAPIFGATKPEHVDSAVAALDVKLDPKALQSISSAYEPRPAVGLSNRVNAQN